MIELNITIIQTKMILFTQRMLLLIFTLVHMDIKVKTINSMVYMMSSAHLGYKVTKPLGMFLLIHV